MSFLAGLLLIGFIVTIGFRYYSSASNAGKSTGISAAIGAGGGALFFILFLLVNGLIDSNMPRWFKGFINEYGDPAGFCLVITGIGILSLFLSGIILKNLNLSDNIGTRAIGFSSIYKNKLFKYTIIGLAIVISIIVGLNLRHNSLQDYYREQEKTIDNIHTLYSMIHEFYYYEDEMPSNLSVFLELSDMVKNAYQEARLDAWGNEIMYVHVENSNAFNLLSPGKDKKFGTKDDLDLKS